MAKSILQEQKPQSIDDIIQDLIDLGRTDLYCLFSGGKNSSCTTHYIKKNYQKYFKGTIYTVTGIGSSQTRKFVVDYCKKMNWPLTFTWPKDYERWIIKVLEHGFAGPGNHGMWMGFLKYHSWRSFILDRLDNHNELPVLISGVYRRESNARFNTKQYSKKPIDWDGRVCFAKPFFYKNGVFFWNYLKEHNLKKSPTYEWFNRSGDCYCGSKTEAWELSMIKKYDPISYENIKWTEKLISLIGNEKELKKEPIAVQNLVRKYGTAKAKKYPTWSNGPKTEDLEQQTFLDDYCGESCGTD